MFYLLKAAVSSLKQEYKENETTLAEAQALAIKVLSKTLDMTKLTPEKGIHILAFKIKYFQFSTFRYLHKNLINIVIVY